MNVSILTINIQSGAGDWPRRLPVLVEQVAGLAPDVIALQEVSPDGGIPDAAEQLAKTLSYAHVETAPRRGSKRKADAPALVSRLPLRDPERLELGGQNRLAQRAAVEVGGRRIHIVNTHLFWQPGDSQARLEQVERLLAWTAEASYTPAVICGDFNGTPETRAIARMRQDYTSAYAAIHGAEPEYTFPTPLPRSKLELLLSVWDLLFYLRPSMIGLPLRNTLDYIFVDRRLRVLDCRRVLDHPSPRDPKLYPSDHYGLWAEVGW